ncbi:MAG: YraN family protein, partial [Chthoniobacterales bacterium]|nr:YraN family protein [Chthoniobacterales bacterium]
MFQETDKKFQETDKKFQATDKKFESTDEKIEKMAKQIEEAGKQLDRAGKQIEETGKEVRETTKQVLELKQTVENLSRRFGDLGNRLGEFVEEMVEPAVLRLFQEQGLEVREVNRRVTFRGGGEGFEVDLIVKDEGVVVAVECKSRLTREAVEEHGKRLGKIRRIASGYEGKVLYGAVAGMVVEEEAQRVAEEEGLYV